MTRPNLFEFATSELSQDAVLCWLAAWAAPDAAPEDEQLHDLGVRFVSALLETQGRSDRISTLKVERQYKSIDVLLRVNSTLAVCIEDKVGTIQHSNQLPRYIETLLGEGIAREDIIPVYVQTFEQSSYQDVHDAGYAQLSRGALIDILKDHAGSRHANAIVRDFHARLEMIDREFESFRTQPPLKWEPRSRVWQGFFCELQRRLADAEWRYVHNQSGGFQGFFWRRREPIPGYVPYLQIEEDTLCFKIVVEEKDARARLRDQWLAYVRDEAKAHDLEVTRPTRLGNGNTMTVAKLLGDYRQTDSRGLLDLEGTVALLQRAEAVHDHAVERMRRENMGATG